MLRAVSDALGITSGMASDGVVDLCATSDDEGASDDDSTRAAGAAGMEEEESSDDEGGAPSAAAVAAMRSARLWGDGLAINDIVTTSKNCPPKALQDGCAATSATSALLRRASYRATA